MKRIVSFLLVALMIFGFLPMNAIHSHAAVESATITFDAAKTQRTSFSTTQQVWTSGDVTFTNNKAGSSSNVADYSNPVRLYAGSSIVFEHTGGANITKIEVTANSTSYASTLKNIVGSEATVSSKVVTIALSTPASMYTIASLTSQVRLNSITVYYEAADAACAHTNTTTKTVDATCTEAGSTTVTCNDCGETVSTEEIAALGHSWNNGEVTASPTCSAAGTKTFTCTACSETKTESVAALGHDYENGTCTTCGATLPVITFVVPNGVAAIDAKNADENGNVELPSAGEPEGYTFVGWVAEEITEATAEKPEIIPAGNYTATANITLYALYTYEEEGEGSSGTGDYVKVTETLADWSGEYVIVYEADSYVLNSSLSSMDVASNYKAVPITNNTISATDADPYKFTIEAIDGGYALLGINGSYIGGQSSSNKLVTSTSALLNTIEIDANGNATIVSNTSHLRYNSASDQCRFRYFKSTSYSSQQAVALYKKSSGASNTTYYTTEISGGSSTECEHTNTTTTTVDATCTAVGSTTVTCDDCGNTISTTEIPKLDHSYDAGVVTDPTCTEAGYTTYTCSVCGNTYKGDEVAANGHKYESVTSGLTTTYTCTVCGDTYSETANLEVKYELITLDTITAGNYVIGAVRNGSYPTVYLATDTTSSGDWVVSSTSVAAENDIISGELPSDVQVFVLEGDNTNGFTIGYHNGTEMVYLGYTAYSSRKLAFSASYSSYLWKVVEDTDGDVALRYTNGSNSYTISQNSTGTSAIRGYANSTIYTGIYLFAEAEPDCVHIYDAGVVTQPSCTTDGYTTYTCSACQHTYTDSIVEATGHNWNEGDVTTAPGCTTTGVKTYTCTVCSHSYTEAIPATGHTMGEGVVVDATCETAGSKTYTCTVCGEQQSETIPATGHNWDEGVVTTAATCDTAGVKTYTCSNAGCTKTEEIAAIGHSWDEGQKISAATCDTPGSILYTCQNDNSHTKTETTPVLGHQYSSGTCTVCGKEVSRFQLVTDYTEILAGGEYVIAAKVGDSFYAINSASGTDWLEAQSVAVTGTGADMMIIYADGMPMWNVEYFLGRNNCFSLYSTAANQYLAGSESTSLSKSTTPWAWTFIDGSNENGEEDDGTFAVTQDDGSVAFVAASATVIDRAISLKSTTNFTNYSVRTSGYNRELYFFKLVKANASEYTVKFVENGTTTITQDVPADNNVLKMPQPTGVAMPEGYTKFVGWVELPHTESLVAPSTIYSAEETDGANNTVNITQDKTFYALYSREDPDAEGEALSYHLVTDSKQLVIGQKYIVVGIKDGQYYAMSKDQLSGDRGASTVTPDADGVITFLPKDNVGIFELSQGYEIGSFAFLDLNMNKFLYCASTGTENALKSQTSLDEKASFLISINADSNYSIIISQTTTSSRTNIMFNTVSDSHIFSCYDPSATSVDATQTFLYVGVPNSIFATYYTTGLCAHDWEVTEHVDATCEHAGYTIETCSICGEVRVTDTVAHGHDIGSSNVVTDPTCTTTGLAQSVCNNCGVTFDEILPVVNHTPVADAAVAPTCTETGLTEGSHCSVCNQIITAQQTVAALGHTEVADAAIAPTCTATGLTEGSHCSVCNEVLVAQNEVSALGHSYEAVTTNPTCTVAGKTIYTCSVCDDSYEEEIPALGHTEVVDDAVAATCTATGLTEGSHCSVCNEVLVAQTVADALGHAYDKIDVVDKTFESNSFPENTTCPTIVGTCSRCNEENIVIAQLRFTGAAPVLENTLVMNYTAHESVLGVEGYGFTNVNAVFEYGERQVEKDTAVSATLDVNNVNSKGRYILPCSKITPSQIGDNITATLYGDYNGTTYKFEMPIEYSVAQYCYNQLGTSTDAKLRTLLVDLLYYCDAARTYTTYKTNEPVTNTDLITEEMKAAREAATPTLTSILNTKYAEIASPTASWKAASLVLYHATAMKLRFTAEGIDNPTVKFTIDGAPYTYAAQQIEGNPDQYYVQFDKINAYQMRVPVYATVYNGNTAISNTLCYSVESYAYAKQEDPDTDLVNLLIAMMRYGDSAVAYNAK